MDKITAKRVYTKPEPHHYDDILIIRRYFDLQSLAQNSVICGECRVNALRLNCDNIRRLDLGELVRRGFGVMALTQLPSRCADCRSNRCRVIVSSRTYLR